MPFYFILFLFISDFYGLCVQRTIPETYATTKKREPSSMLYMELLNSNILECLSRAICSHPHLNCLFKSLQPILPFILPLNTSTISHNSTIIIHHIKPMMCQHCVYLIINWSGVESASRSMFLGLMSQRSLNVFMSRKPHLITRQVKVCQLLWRRCVAQML